MRRRGAWGSALALFGLVLAVAPEAKAQNQTQGGKLEARYEASLAGIPVGKGTWTIDISATTSFPLRPPAGTTGLLKALCRRFRLRPQSQGRVVAGTLVPLDLYRHHRLVEEIRDHPFT